MTDWVNNSNLKSVTLPTDNGSWVRDVVRSN